MQEERIKTSGITAGKRIYDPAFKAQIVAQSFESGRRVIDVAQEHGIHPSLLTKWRRKHGAALTHKPVAEPTGTAQTKPFGFVPLSVASPPTSSATVHLELERQDMRLAIDWPVAHLDGCLKWLSTWCR